MIDLSGAGQGRRRPIPGTAPGWAKRPIAHRPDVGGWQTGGVGRLSRLIQGRRLLSVPHGEGGSSWWEGAGSQARNTGMASRDGAMAAPTPEAVQSFSRRSLGLGMNLRPEQPAGFRAAAAGGTLDDFVSGLRPGQQARYAALTSPSEAGQSMTNPQMRAGRYDKMNAMNAMPPTGDMDPTMAEALRQGGLQRQDAGALTRLIRRRWEY